MKPSLLFFLLGTYNTEDPITKVRETGMNSTKIFTATGNISYVLSQTARVLSDFFIRKFPHGYFKDVVIGSESISVREQRHLEERQTTDKVSDEFIRKTPALSIKPIYTMEETISENPTENKWKHIAMNHGHLNEMAGSYPHIFFDEKYDRYAFTLPKFHRLNFEVAIRTDGEMSMWDAMSWLKHGVIFNEFFYMNRHPMSAVIPNIIVYALAGEYDMDLEDETDRASFLEVLRGSSRQAINEIVDPSKARPFYIFNYTSNLLLKFDSLPSGELQEQDQSKSRGEITFSGQVQFHTPTNFAVETRDFDPSYGEVIEDVLRESLTPSVAVTRLAISPKSELEDGKQLVFFKGFVTEAPASTDQSVPVYGDEKNPWPIKGSTFIDNGPGLVLVDGWNGGIGALNTVFAEETTFVDVEGESVQLIESTDGVFEFQSNDINFDRRRRRHKVVIRAACDIERMEFDVIFGNYEAEQFLSRFRFTWPSKYQTFELGIPIPNDICSITIKPTVQQACKLWLAEVSVVPRFGTVLTTLTEDLVHLRGHLGLVENVIDSNIAAGTDNDVFFGIRVIQKGADYLDQSKLSMDWEEKILTVQNPFFNTTHYVALYADLKQFKNVRGVEV